MSTIYILLTVSLMIILYLIFGLFKPRNFPPGPQWLPIVGNTPEIKKLSHKLGGQHHAFTYLANLYNTKVLGLKLGSDYFVVVFTKPLIQQILTKEVFQARPDNFFIRLRSMGTRKGITMADGSHWEEQRSFAVKHLRDLGFGKTVMEDLMLEELQETINKLKKGGEIQWSKIFAPSVLNVLWALAAGSRFPSDDLNGLLQLMDARSRAFDMAGGILSQLPWLRHVAPDYTGFNLITKLNSELSDLLMKTIEEHRKTLREDITRDFIDAFLHEMKLKNGKPSTFTDDQLVMVCLDFFIAGSKTTSDTLDFALLHVLLHPDVQERVHQEIDYVLPDGKMPTLADRIRLPYTEAVVLESQRLKHVVPINGPRRVLYDTVIDGYYIPKDTTVLMNLHHLHHDENEWKNPNLFYPERFLDSNGKFCPEQMYLFGYGKRRCLGETLARNFVFLFFVGLLKHFKSLVPEKEPPTLEPNAGITLSPKPYTVIVQPRSTNKL